MVIFATRECYRLKNRYHTYYYQKSRAPAKGGVGILSHFVSPGVQRLCTGNANVTGDMWVAQNLYNIFDAISQSSIDRSDLSANIDFEFISQK